MENLHTLGEQNSTASALYAEALFSDFVQELYLPFVQKTKRHWKADMRNLDRHILPHLGSYRLSDISIFVLKSWTNALELTGLAYRFCFRLFRLAKYVLKCAVRWGVPSRNAAFKSANLPSNPGRKTVPLNSVEVLQLLEMHKNYLHRVSGLRHSFANFFVSVGINQRNLRGILGYYKPDPFALGRNNSFESNVRV